MLLTVWVHLNVLLAFFTLAYPRVVLSILDPSGNLAHKVARLWGRWILASAGIPVKVKGKEKLLRDRPQVIFSNHSSYFDVFCLLAYLPIQFRWLAKAELFRIPLFGKAMEYGGYLPIDRSNPRRAHESMIRAAQRIKDGTSIVIFPEGTRSQDGKLKEFKSGGAILAIKAQVPIVPVALVGTHDVMPKGSLRVKRRAIELRIGEPISTEGLTQRDRDLVLEKARERILRLLEEA